MVRRVFGVLIVLLGLGVVARPLYTYTSEWLAVDQCLDSGGSFDYSRMECDYRSNHPSVSFEKRHPGLLHRLHVFLPLSTSVALCGVIIAAWPRRYSPPN